MDSMLQLRRGLDILSEHGCKKQEMLSELAPSFGALQCLRSCAECTSMPRP